MWWKFNFGPKLIRCRRTECYPEPSELTRSDFKGRIADLQADGFVGTSFEELRNSAEEVTSALNTLADECEEKFNNMPESLQGGDTGQLLSERCQTLRNCASSIEEVYIPCEDAPEGEDGEETDSLMDDYKEGLEKARQQLKTCLEDLDCG
jgi:hypothetical protein